MGDEAVVQIWQAVIFGVAWCVTVVTYACYKTYKRDQEFEREKFRAKEARDVLKGEM